jgi:hypothetical protein
MRRNILLSNNRLFYILNSLALFGIEHELTYFAPTPNQRCLDKAAGIEEISAREPCIVRSSSLTNRRAKR